MIPVSQIDTHPLPMCDATVKEGSLTYRSLTGSSRHDVHCRYHARFIIGDQKLCVTHASRRVLELALQQGGL